MAAPREELLLAWAQARPGLKRLRSLRAFRELAGLLADRGLDAEEWCTSLADDVRAIAEEHGSREWTEVVELQVSGGSGEGSDGSRAAAAAARQRGVSAGLSRLLRERGEDLWPLLEALAAEWRGEGAADDDGERPSRPWRSATVTFESRPFGMTPAKSADGLGYLVEKVNHNDPSKPAARLGVRAGWLAARLNGDEVASLPSEEVQRRLKELPLPVTLEFRVPPRGRA